MKISKTIAMLATAGALTISASVAKAAVNVYTTYPNTMIHTLDVSGTFLTQNDSTYTDTTEKWTYDKVSFGVKDLLSLLVDCTGNTAIDDNGNYIVVLDWFDDGVFVVDKNGNIVANISDEIWVEWDTDVSKGTYVFTGNNDGKESVDSTGIWWVYFECDNGEETFFDFYLGGEYDESYSNTAFNNDGEAKAKDTVSGSNMIGDGSVTGDSGLVKGKVNLKKGKAIWLD